MNLTAKDLGDTIDDWKERSKQTGLELFRKVAEGQLNGEELRKVCKSSPLWEVIDEERVALPSILDCSREPEDMLQAAGYSNPVPDAVRRSLATIPQSAYKRAVVELWRDTARPGYLASPERVVKKMRKDGWEEGTLYHLLAISCQFPGIQRFMLINGLGTAYGTRILGVRLMPKKVPFIGGNCDGYRILGIAGGWWEFNYDERFVAVKGIS
ncbi:MAG: hypothetical protein HY436_00130 [Candidatus Liptonbacteria bacterium]|nr:hypothetical protein [Candidatus Liptonbacteria bacterium]